MDGRRRMLDDVAKLATGAAGLVQGAGREAESLLRQRLERLLDRMDLVPRDEFDAVKEMAAAARLENERLAARIAALEAAIQPSDTAAARSGAPTRANRAPAAGRRRSRAKAAESTSKSQKSAKKRPSNTT